jgi:hypothetical protein
MLARWLFRPPAGAEGAQDLDVVACDAVGHDIWRARHDQLAGAWPPTGAAAAGHLGEQADRDLDALHDARRGPVQKRWAKRT